MAASIDVDDYARGVLAGDRTMIARAITLVESRRGDHTETAQELLSVLLPHSGQAHRVGISGVPGVGKSTFIDALGALLTSRGHRVAVLAVDPSSTVSGGSILGDRTRMARLSSDPAAFVRPSPTAGTLGGVARATRETMIVMEAAGFDVVLVETVGVGQSEVAVAGMVDTFLLLTLARTGDHLQGIKRGVLELVHVVGVNKADGPHADEAEATRRELERALGLLRATPEEDDDPWRPRVRTCSAMTGAGLDELWGQLCAHREQAQRSGAWQRRRQRQRVDWMWSQVTTLLMDRLREHPRVRAVAPVLEEQVRSGEVSATTAARDVLRALDGTPSP
jgi:LAO/AO transport system kinase